MKIEKKVKTVSKYTPVEEEVTVYIAEYNGNTLECSKEETALDLEALAKEYREVLISDNEFRITGHYFPVRSENPWGIKNFRKYSEIPYFDDAVDGIDSRFNEVSFPCFLINIHSERSTDYDTVENNCVYTLEEFETLISDARLFVAKIDEEKNSKKEGEV